MGVAQTVAHVCADELYTNANVHISLALLGARSNELLAAVSRGGLETVCKRILGLCRSLRNFSLPGVGVAVVVTDRDVVRLRHTVDHAGVSLRVVVPLKELCRQVTDAGRTGVATVARCGRGSPRARVERGTGKDLSPAHERACELVWRVVRKLPGRTRGSVREDSPSWVMHVPPWLRALVDSPCLGSMCGKQPGAALLRIGTVRHTRRTAHTLSLQDETRIEVYYKSQ